MAALSRVTKGSFLVKIVFTLSLIHAKVRSHFFAAMLGRLTFISSATCHINSL